MIWAEKPGKSDGGNGHKSIVRGNMKRVNMTCRAIGLSQNCNLVEIDTLVDFIVALQQHLIAAFLPIHKRCKTKSRPEYKMIDLFLNDKRLGEGGTQTFVALIIQY